MSKKLKKRIRKKIIMRISNAVAIVIVTLTTIVSFQFFFKFLFFYFFFFSLVLSFDKFEKKIHNGENVNITKHC